MSNIDREGLSPYPKRYNYEANRSLAIEILGGKCVVCGTTKDLEIDHVQRELKGFDISSMLSICTPEEVKEELKKCQLLCHEHHMEKTIRERGQKAARGTHGTLSSYRYCKCDLCRAAHSKHLKEWKAKRKKKNDTDRPPAHDVP